MHRHPRSFLILGIIIILVGGLLTGCGPKTVKTTAASSLEAFVAEAKNQPEPPEAAEGSLWADHGRQSNLFRDFKARQVNDIVTIRVFERTTANASADAKNSKNSQVEAGVGSLAGLEGKIKELPNLVSGQGSSTFEGEGSTTRASTVSTTITARVKDVLPNGYLVIQGVREVRLNNENQTVYLTGIVRPEDISAGNIVSSAAVAQMEVRVQGRGTVSQPLKPGWLYRILTGVMPF